MVTEESDSNLQKLVSPYMITRKNLDDSARSWAFKVFNSINLHQHMLYIHTHVHVGGGGCLIY